MKQIERKAPGGSKPETADDIAGNKLALSMAEKLRSTLELTQKQKTIKHYRCGEPGCSNTHSQSGMLCSSVPVYED